MGEDKGTPHQAARACAKELRGLRDGDGYNVEGMTQ